MLLCIYQFGSEEKNGEDPQLKSMVLYGSRWIRENNSFCKVFVVWPELRTSML